MQRLAFATITGLLLVATASGVVAGRVYRWTDSKGVVHYGDRPPDGAAAPRPAQIRQLRVSPQPGAIARLRVENEGHRYLAWADNQLGGPIEVRLRLQSQRNVVSDPALPARATVPARGSTLVAVLEAAEPGEAGEFRLAMDTLPGDPSARPRDVEYLLPLRLRSARVDQGFGGRFSHVDVQNRHAVDFAAPIGTPVVAARDGVVMQVESDYDKAGLNLEKYGGRANFIRIAHDDGTMGLYAHLKTDGVLVRVGQRVRAGQQIGLSGNTGFTTGPHLHFAVQVNRGMALESVPFRMRGPAGPLRLSGSR